MKFFLRVFCLCLLAMGLMLFFMLNNALAQLPDISEFTLVLHLQASNGFIDLSDYNHIVEKIDPVIILSDGNGKDYYWFNGGYLRIPDTDILDYNSSEELYIEISFKITNLSADQEVMLSKGNLPGVFGEPGYDLPYYLRNYGISYTGTNTPGGLFLINILYGGWTAGISLIMPGPSDPIPSESEWTTFAVLASEADTCGPYNPPPPEGPSECIKTSYYKDGTWIWEDYLGKEDGQINDFPLYIGTGFATGDFMVHPFTGYIEYVKIYKRIQTPSIIEAEVNIDPDTLNVKSKGKWITAYIELPEGYDVNNIDINTVKLQYNDSSVEAEWGHIQGTAYMVKFNRDLVKEFLNDVTGNVELKVTGEVDDTLFEGSDTIKVIDKGKNKK